MLDCFNTPNHIFYFKATKDYIDNNIKTTSKSEKEFNQRQLLHEKYIEIEEEIVKILKLQGDRFICLDKSLKTSLCEQSMKVLKPKVIFALPGKSEEKCNEFIQKMVKERGYIHLDVKTLTNLCIKRGCFIKTF